MTTTNKENWKKYELIGGPMDGSFYTLPEQFKYLYIPVPSKKVPVYLEYVFQDGQFKYNGQTMNRKGFDCTDEFGTDGFSPEKG